MKDFSEFTSKYKYVCPYCGGANITHDATVQYNAETQEYDVLGVLDAETCEDCEREVKALFVSAD